VVIGGKAPTKHRAAPYDPLQPLGGKGFNQEVNQIVGAKYDPQQRELQSQQRISGANLQRTNDWYDQYRATLAANNAQANQQAQQGVQGQQAQVNTAASQDEQNRQRLQAEQEASAKLRGATIDPGVQSQALQASQARRAIGNAGISQLQNRATANATYGSQMQNVAAGSKLQALNDEAARGRQLSKLGLDLASERGQYKGVVRGDLRDKERTYALNRQAYGLKAYQAQSQAQHQRAQDRNVRHGQNLISQDKRKQRAWDKRKSDRQYNLDVQKFGHQKAKDNWTQRYKQAHPPGSGRGGRGGSGTNPAGLTPSSRRGYKDKWEGYVGNVRTGQKPPKGVNPMLGSAALEYERNRKRTGKGYVSDRTRRAIRKRFGFWIPGAPARAKGNPFNVPAGGNLNVGTR
jgi:hypothetical protein